MNVHEFLAQQIAQARQQFESQLGESSLCQVTKDGRITGGMKYAEGQLVALRNLEKRIRAGESIESALQAEQAFWQALYDQHTAQTWRAYAQGGLDACANCSSALTRP
ncbi:MAG: hypothetical protein RML95_04260 [Anaerolineae bacterium]|nr:hypothetical protein [Anaerolineae bacterium]MDW8298530.1 hypothetical protein [Anaerolineae bacterium]